MRRVESIKVVSSSFCHTHWYMYICTATTTIANQPTWIISYPWLCTSSWAIVLFFFFLSGHTLTQQPSSPTHSTPEQLHNWRASRIDLVSLFRNSLVRDSSPLQQWRLVRSRPGQLDGHRSPRNVAIGSRNALPPPAAHKSRLFSPNWPRETAMESLPWLWRAIRSGLEYRWMGYQRLKSPIWMTDLNCEKSVGWRHNKTKTVVRHIFKWRKSIFARDFSRKLDSQRVHGYLLYRSSVDL